MSFTQSCIRPSSSTDDRNRSTKPHETHEENQEFVFVRDVISWIVRSLELKIAKGLSKQTLALCSLPPQFFLMMFRCTTTSDLARSRVSNETLSLESRVTICTRPETAFSSSTPFFPSSRNPSTSVDLGASNFSPRNSATASI